MGYVKNRMMEEHDKLTGNDIMPAANGGYITIYKGDEQLLHIASVPSSYWTEERHIDSLVVNIEEFVDENDNKYVIEIGSSTIGVEWFLEIYPVKQEQREELVEKIKMVYEMDL